MRILPKLRKLILVSFYWIKFNTGNCRWILTLIAQANFPVCKVFNFLNRRSICHYDALEKTSKENRNFIERKRSLNYSGFFSFSEFIVISCNSRLIMLLFVKNIYYIKMCVTTHTKCDLRCPCCRQLSLFFIRICALFILYESMSPLRIMEWRTLLDRISLSLSRILAITSRISRRTTANANAAVDYCCRSFNACGLTPMPDGV